MSYVKVEDLSKSFSFYISTGIFKREKKIKQAVSNISFDVSKGEILGIVGANGDNAIMMTVQ